MQTVEVQTNYDYVPDLFHVEGKSPDRQYRFVANQPGRVAEMKTLGYKVTDSKGLKTLVPSESETSILIGDVLLMDCPKALFAKRQQASADLSTARTKAPKQDFREYAARHGVQIIEGGNS